MRYLLIMLVSLAIYLGYLIIEQISLKKIQKKIAIRICVTGTRGKSGVVRMIAAILRESGRKTLAKVTGSKPVVIWPDGRETKIRRLGPANILEQIKIMRLAGRLRVDAVVFEIMSIHPENHYVESCKIINPQVVAITNIRLDHTGQMGRDKAEIAATIGLTIPRGSMVFVNEADYNDFFERISKDHQATALAAPKLNHAELQNNQVLKQVEFLENIELSLAVADFCGIERGRALTALLKTTPDFGALRVWELTDPINLRKSLMISAFAANDPESTRKVFDKCREKIENKYKDEDIVGLLNLRADRPERTVQWSDALRNGACLSIGRIILIGDRFACLYLQKKLRGHRDLKVSVITEKQPQKIMEAVFKTGAQHSVVFGFGNLKGAGEKLINHWELYGRKVG